MTIDPANPVVALCAAGMAIEGERERARLLFQEAWDRCQDDYEASIAAHFLARHQPTPDACLQWNARAAQHAEAVTPALGVQASLYRTSRCLLGFGDARGGPTLDTCRGHVPALTEAVSAFVELASQAQHRCERSSPARQKSTFVAASSAAELASLV